MLPREAISLLILDTRPSPLPVSIIKIASIAEVIETELVYPPLGQSFPLRILPPRLALHLLFFATFFQKMIPTLPRNADSDPLSSSLTILYLSPIWRGRSDVRCFFDEFSIPRRDMPISFPFHPLIGFIRCAPFFVLLPFFQDWTDWQLQSIYAPPKDPPVPTFLPSYH